MKRFSYKSFQVHASPDTRRSQILKNRWSLKICSLLHILCQLFYVSDELSPPKGHIYTFLLLCPSYIVNLHPTISLSSNSGNPLLNPITTFQLPFCLNSPHNIIHLHMVLHNYVNDLLSTFWGDQANFFLALHHLLNISKLYRHQSSSIQL